MAARIDLHDRAAAHAEVQHFYAHQIRLLDAADAVGFADTFTEDGVMAHTSRNDHVQGRQAIVDRLTASYANHPGVVPRHWFDKLLIEPLGEDTVAVSYYALVSLTDVEGRVEFQPTCLVDDVLVLRGDRLLTRSRTIRRDDLLLTAPQGDPVGSGRG